CTTDNCYGGVDDKFLIAMVSRLQDTVERQQLQLTEMNDAMLSMKQDMTKYEQELSELKKPKQQPPEHDCDDLRKAGYTASGVYNVHLVHANKTIKVYCDQTTDGGGWLVFQRRLDGTVDFFRDWISYKEGFGNVFAEFWLAFNGSHAYAVYSNFGVSSESDNYRLSLGQYSGTAGDSLTYHADQQFSTKYRDNDRSSSDCANEYKGGWWYNNCHESNLNGQYLHGLSDPYQKGIVWRTWTGAFTSLKKVAMKLRP
ncbi:Fibrinogen C domain-containing protein 1-B, partial [Lamellibrachia satsuma]